MVTLSRPALGDRVQAPVDCISYTPFPLFSQWRHQQEIGGWEKSEVSVCIFPTHVLGCGLIVVVFL